MPKRLYALLTLPLATVFLLSACTFSVGTTGTDDDVDTSQSEDESTDEDTTAPDDGELSEPGTRVGLNEWLTYSYSTIEDGEALISARLVSVEEASSAEADYIYSSFSNGEADGYTFYFLRWEEKKVSGGTTLNESDFNFFDAVDADGVVVQSYYLAHTPDLASWDCVSGYFDEKFDAAEGVVTHCLVAALTPTGTVPAGVAFSGGFEEGNPYDFSEGNALYFIKE